MIAGLMIAAVGYIDDKRGLPALPRFVVHLLASALLVFGLLCQLGYTFDEPFALAHCVRRRHRLTAWSINLFNFMDGIDGIAASQALFITAASAALVVLRAKQGSSLCYWSLGVMLGLSYVELAAGQNLHGRRRERVPRILARSTGLGAPCRRRVKYLDIDGAEQSLSSPMRQLR